jgi:hypothetical protein
VVFAGLGLALPTLSFGFWKSFFFSLFFFALDPMVPNPKRLGTVCGRGKRRIDGDNSNLFPGKIRSSVTF